MNKVTEFRRRYEVQIANTISGLTTDVQGRWEFAFGFHEEIDAFAAADRLAEDHRWVRVVDTQDNDEDNNA